MTAASALHALPATEPRSSVAPVALLGRFWGPPRGAPTCARARVRRRGGRSAARWRPARLQRAKFPPQVARRGVSASELARPRLASPGLPGAGVPGDGPGGKGLVVSRGSRAASWSCGQTSAPDPGSAPALGPRVASFCLAVPAGLLVRRERRAAAAERGRRAGGGTEGGD